MRVKIRLILTVILFMFCFGMTSEASQWDCGTALDPYEVRIFQHPEFAGECKTFKLDPDARLHQEPKIEEMFSFESIQVGSKVEVLLFEAPNFCREVGSGFSQPDSFHTILNLFLHSQKLDFQPWTFRVSESLKVIGVQVPFNPQSIRPVSTSSFIITHKNSRVQGVTILTEYEFGPPALDGSKSFKANLHFFPLSENKKLNIAEYPYTPTSFMNFVLYKPLIRIDKGIRCEFFTNWKFSGNSIVLPPPGSKKDHFALENYNIYSVGSIKVVQTTVEGSAGMVGTANGQVQKPKQPVVGTLSPDLKEKAQSVLKDQKPYTATGTMLPITGGSVPGSPSKMPQVGGQWKDNSGIVYNYGQKDEKIWWRAPSKQLYGGGVINGDRITTTIYYEQNNTVAGKVSGTVKDVDVNGVAQRIEWEDGNSFKR